MFRLVIGNKNYSSWSLRAWLYLTESRVPFEEVKIPLFSGDWRERLAEYTPAGRVPVLLDGDLRIWDTMAIIDHVREEHPEALGFPSDAKARARARSIAAEMHAGFLAIRDELPQNLRRRTPRARSQLSEACQDQIARIEEMWISCRYHFGQGGPWLFGEMTIADIMYAPVALRFITYSIPLSGAAMSFINQVEQLPSVKRWCEEAMVENEQIDFIDDLAPASTSPLSFG